MEEQERRVTTLAAAEGDAPDESLEAEVSNRLAEDHGIDDSEIQVRVTRGEVRLPTWRLEGGRRE